jgi:hypothetical protein
MFTYLHPFSLKQNIPSITFATNCPHAIIATLQDTRRPLICDGAASAIYIGVVIEVKPEIRGIEIFLLKSLILRLNIHKMYCVIPPGSDNFF